MSPKHNDKLISAILSFFLVSFEHERTAREHKVKQTQLIIELSLDCSENNTTNTPCWISGFPAGWVFPCLTVNLGEITRKARELSGYSRVPRRGGEGEGELTQGLERYRRIHHVKFSAFHGDQLEYNGAGRK